jgi:hypothetical protein
LSAQVLKIEIVSEYCSPVIPQYNRKSMVFGVLGLFVQIGCAWPYLNSPSNIKVSPPAWTWDLFRIGFIGGTIFWIVGLCYYAKAKGHDAAWGLLGSICCIGLLILGCFKDRSKTLEDPPPPPSP